MKQINWRYWLCQICGWGIWCLFGLYLTFVVYEDSFKNLYSNSPNEYFIAKQKYIYALIITFFTALIVTHSLRFILKKIDWLKYNFNNLLFIFLIGAISAGFAFYFVSDIAERKFKVSLDVFKSEVRLTQAKELENNLGLNEIDYYSPKKIALNDAQVKGIVSMKKNTGWGRNMNGEWRYTERSNLVIIYQSIILIALWLLIYFVWHYLVRSRKDQMDRIRLETTVKELELKTIKAHINPHFIFNSLNSIRALVDEIPKEQEVQLLSLVIYLEAACKQKKQKL